MHLLSAIFLFFLPFTQGCVRFQWNPMNACGCTGEIVENHNAKTLIGHRDFYSYFAPRQMRKPIASWDKSCRLDTLCSSELTRVIFTKDRWTAVNSNITCRNGKFYLSTANYQLSYDWIYLTCAGIPPQNPMGTCGCNGELFDNSNVQPLFGHRYFYDNLTSYELTKPSVYWDSTCQLISECPAGLTKIIVHENDWTMDNFTITCIVGIWRLSNQHIDIGQYYAYMTCADMTPKNMSSCGKCAGELIDSSNAFSLIGNRDFYSNITSHPFTKPIISWTGNCKLKLNCAPGFTGVYISEYGWDQEEVFNVTCEEEAWTFENPDMSFYRENLYATCVDFATSTNPMEQCGCTGELIDSSNALSLIGNRGFYSNLTSHPIAKPVISWSSSCQLTLNCPTGFTAIVVNDATWMKKEEFNVTCGDEVWTFDSPGTSFYKEYLYATCVDFATSTNPMEQCGCTGELIDRSNAFSLIGNRGFYTNLTSHLLRLPTISYSSTCQLMVDCPPGFTGVLINDVNWMEKEEFNITCGDEVWTFDSPGTSFYKEYLYTTCVAFDFYINPMETCGCHGGVIDSNNSLTLFGNRDFYPNLTSHRYEKPTVALSSACELAVSCAPGFTAIVVNDADWMKKDEVNVTCENNRWTFGNSTVSKGYVYATCVEFEPTPCPCTIELLDASNVREFIGFTDFYASNLSNYEISKPTISGGCPSDFDCGGLNKVVAFNDGRVKDIGTNSAQFSCDSDLNWYLDGVGARELYLTCVDYSKPIGEETEPPVVLAPWQQCGCPGELLDSENAPDFISIYPAYYNHLIKYNMEKPIPQVTSQIGCVTEFTCPSGFTKVAIGQERWDETESLKLWCTDNQWSVIMANDFYSSPYAFVTCVDYNSPTPEPIEKTCFCEPVNLLTSVEDPSYQLVNWKLLVRVIDPTDPCILIIFCQDGATARFWAAGQFWMKESLSSFCHPTKQLWEVEAENQKPWVDTTVFNISCVQQIAGSS